jgi:hypothetical protein
MPRLVPGFTLRAAVARATAEETTETMMEAMGMTGVEAAKMTMTMTLATEATTAMMIPTMMAMAMEMVTMMTTDRCTPTMKLSSPTKTCMAAIASMTQSRILTSKW